MPAHKNRQTPKPIPCGQNAVLRHQQYSDGAANHLLRVQYAIHQIFLHVYKGGYKLRNIDLSVALRHELMSMVGKIRFYKLIGIVDYTNRAYGIQPQMGAHQQRLRVCIAYAAHANMPLKLAQVAFELSAEGGVFNIMNLADESVFAPVDHHSAAACAQMGMVVRAEKHIKSHIAVGKCSEKAAHYAKKSSESVMGSIYLQSL